VIRVDVIRAWPRRFESVAVMVPDAATVGDALAASGFALDEVVALAVFGERVDHQYRLHEGDRIELLRPLQIDPKEARRRRAGQQSGSSTR
jgi:uncharacterized protein